MKNKYIIFFLKAILAGIFAFIILNIICMFYANPLSHFSSETGSTDYVWEKSAFYSRGSEGFAWGVSDENGFNNLKTFPHGEIDVLVLGSSHMEGFNVAQDKNAVALLNKHFLDEEMDMNAYNISVSGHTLQRCLGNALDAVEEFKPTRYVVIEASKLKMDNAELKAAADGTLESLESQNNPLIVMAQELPFLRKVYGLMKKTNADEPDNEEDFDIKIMDGFMGKVSEQLKSKGIELIIVFNCTPSYDESGVITETEDYEAAKELSKICQNHDVTFVHMRDAYIESYNKTKILPHGFSNSEAGFGHLNEHGHSLVAEELFKAICRLEEN